MQTCTFSQILPCVCTSTGGKAIIQLINSRCVRYHLGSIALGSFIIAVIQFIRAVLEYVDRQMKAADPGNVVMNYLMACVK